MGNNSDSLFDGRAMAAESNGRGACFCARIVLTTRRVRIVENVFGTLA